MNFDTIKINFFWKSPHFLTPPPWIFKSPILKLGYFWNIYIEQKICTNIPINIIFCSIIDYCLKMVLDQKTFRTPPLSGVWHLRPKSCSISRTGKIRTFQSKSLKFSKENLSYPSRKSFKYFWSYYHVFDYQIE